LKAYRPAPGEPPRVGIRRWQRSEPYASMQALRMVDEFCTTKVPYQLIRPFAPRDMSIWGSSRIEVPDAFSLVLGQSSLNMEKLMRDKNSLVSRALKKGLQDDT